MSVLDALILGLIQGLTEFIPVSSSGHLVLLHHLLGVTESGLAFDVALHGGTLIALLLYFRKDVLELLRSVFHKNEKTRLAWLLVVATIPAAVFGFLLEDLAESSFRSVRLVSLTMLVFGVVMLIAERYYKTQKTHLKVGQIGIKQALAVGFAQALALIPGVSRSGSTITAGLFVGLDHVAATRFSFLLGIPIMIGAVVRVCTQDGFLQQAQSGQTVFIVGILTALLSGLLAIRFMLRYLSKYGLHVFAYYRIALALVVVIVLGVR